MGPTHPNSFTPKLPIDYEDGEAVDTCPDFWKLCWDSNATVIVMLCNISPGFRFRYDTFILLQKRIMN